MGAEELSGGGKVAVLLSNWRSDGREGNGKDMANHSNNNIY